jgi:CRP-like cAMP-binding protein
MLAQLPSARLRGLAAAHPVRSFPAGEALLRQGDPAGRLLILLEGQATAVTDHDDGTRSRFPLMTAPCVFAGQQGIAEELGLSRVTVNRALQRLAGTGVIRTRPRAIIILYPTGLHPSPR